MNGTVRAVPFSIAVTLRRPREDWSFVHYAAVLHPSISLLPQQLILVFPSPALLFHHEQFFISDLRILYIFLFYTNILFIRNV